MAPAAAAQIHHELQVTLTPADHQIDAQDTLRGVDGEIRFALHRDLRITAAEGGQLEQLEQTGPVRHYRLRPQGESVTLRYQGPIHHPLRPRGREGPSQGETTRGTISEQGIFLGGASHWYPDLGEPVTFALTVDLPSAWTAVSQGRRQPVDEADQHNNRVRWLEDQPQEAIYLAAGRFSVYQASGAEGITHYAFLRRSDRALARRYLGATGPYIAMYSELLGPYPYAKFALVENFWQSGMGLPSLTLLGSRVIRLPFILHTSYPHEILHNWWGNGVYVDPRRGNWSEGLTVYLADHLLAAQQGEAVEYRRKRLQSYLDYVTDQADFPLIEFSARHSAASSAVGYSKAMMVFHMLRRQLGDEAFVAGLRQLYREHRFTQASFDDVAAVFAEQAPERPIKVFFEQWLERTGAPRLKLSSATVHATDRGYVVTATIEQTQPGPAYRLEVPVAVEVAGRSQAHETQVTMTAKRAQVVMDLPAHPRHLVVDPWFDVFRRLHPQEVPPALSGAFGADQATVILAAQASAEQRQTWRAMVNVWRGHWPQLQVVTDKKIDALPKTGAVWLIGWQNRFLPDLQQATQAYAIDWAEGQLQLPEARLRQDEQVAVITARQEVDADRTLAWMGMPPGVDTQDLAHKLRRYGGFSYVGLQAGNLAPVAKGRWPVLASPLSRALVSEDQAMDANLAPRPPLIERPAGLP